MKPQIVIENYEGRHNSNLDAATSRLEVSQSYKDLSTVCIIPTRGVIPAKVVQSWWSIMTPMNQKFIRIFVVGMEVGAAYSTAVEQIITNPVLSTWKFILTLEEDNMPPPDGLLKLYESIDKYDVVSGIYWTKGEMGQPMIYGDPRSMPLDFIPQKPVPETVQECNGLGMGFNLFKMEIFKDARVPRPFFRTLQEFIPYQGARSYTQDLYFFENIHKLGYKVACDTRVKVGHYDLDQDIVW